MLSYRCPEQPGYKKGGRPYDYFSIMGRVIFWGSFNHLQRLVAVIGKQAFIEYILSMDEIKAKYMSDNNLLFRLVTQLNENIQNKQCIQYIVDALGLTEAKLEEVKAFRYINISQILP